MDGEWEAPLTGKRFLTVNILLSRMQVCLFKATVRLQLQERPSLFLVLLFLLVASIHIPVV